MPTALPLASLYYALWKWPLYAVLVYKTDFVTCKLALGMIITVS